MPIKSVQTLLNRVLSPSLGAAEANMPELYEDLVVRRSEAVYTRGEFEGFAFDIGVRPHYQADSTPRYKFVRFVRLTRVSPVASDRGADNPNMIDYQRDVLAALRQSGIHSVTVIANDPNRLGTMVLYGVQASGDTIEDAQRRSELAITTLQACLAGSYRQMKVRPLSKQEVDWLNTNLHLWNQVAVFRGMPQPRHNVSTQLTLGASGVSREVTVEEQVEEFVRGLTDHSFLLVLLASPLGEESILRMLRRVSHELSQVASDVEKTKTVAAGFALPIGFSGQMGTQHGVGTGHTSSYSEGTSQGQTSSVSAMESFGSSQSATRALSTGTTESVGQTQSFNEQHSAGYAHSESTGLSRGVSQTEGFSDSHTVGQSQTHSTNESSGISEGRSENYGESVGDNTSRSVSNTEGMSQGNTQSTSQSEGGSVGGAVNWGRNAGNGSNVGNSVGDSVSQTDTSGKSVSGNLSIPGIGGLGGGSSWSSSDGVSQSTGQSGGDSGNTGFSTGGSVQNSFSQQTGASNSNSAMSNTSSSTSGSTGNTHSQTTGFGASQQISNSASRGVSSGVSDSVGRSLSNSFGENTSNSTNIGDTVNEGASRGTGTAVSETVGRSASVSDAVGTSTTRGTSQGTSTGDSIGTSTGFQRASNASDSFAQSYGYGASMGVAPTFSVAMSKRILDESKRNLSGILGAQRNRLMLAREEGAYAVSMYLLTPDDRTREAAVGLAKSAFWGTADNGAVPVPFHALVDLEDDERHHLLDHIRTFSACLVQEPGRDALEDHAYSTVLLPSELAVLTHPPRCDVPGIQVSFDAVPYFRIPIDADGPLHLGSIVSGETGEATGYRFGFDPDRLTHTLVAGASGSGKTVSAFRLIYHWVNQPAKSVRVQEPDGGFHMESRQPGAIVLDWKTDFRSLVNIVPPERFRFASLSDPSMGFRFNPLEVPDGVKPGTHRDTVCEIMSMAYGLGIRGRGILYTDLHQLYTQPRPKRWVDPTAAPDEMVSVYDCPEMSRFVGMADLAHAINERLEEVAKDSRKFGNDVKDRLAVVINRMQYLSWDGELVQIYTRETTDEEIENSATYGPKFKDYYDRGLVTKERCFTIGDLVADDNIVVLEGGGLDSLSKRAIIGFLASSIFNYARSKGDGAFNPSKLIVFEEAHEVIEGSTEGMREISGIGASIYEIMYNEGRSYGIRLLSICQTPSLMPPSVIANSSTFVCHNVTVDKDVELAVLKFGKDPRIDDRKFKKFLTMIPVGWCVVRASGGREYLNNDPLLVQTAMLTAPKPTDQQLRSRLLRSAR